MTEARACAPLAAGMARKGWPAAARGDGDGRAPRTKAAVGGHIGDVQHPIAEEQRHGDQRAYRNPSSARSV